MWSQAEHHVHGHPRSGTHYLMALLNENFIHSPGKFRDAFGHNRLVNRHQHGLPIQSDPTWFDGGHHFYIWREFEGVAKSILKMPERFGITEDLTVEEFKEANWRDIYTPNVRWAWKQVHDLAEDGDVERGNTTAFGSTFHEKAISWNTYDFWEHHKNEWQEFAKTRDNVWVVKYESLLNDFQTAASNIALWLGKPTTALKQIEKKVSGQPV